MNKLFLLLLFKFLCGAHVVEASLNVQLMSTFKVRGTHSYCGVINQDTAEAMRRIGQLVPADRLHVDERGYSFDVSNRDSLASNELSFTSALPVYSCQVEHAASDVFKVRTYFTQARAGYESWRYSAEIRPWVMAFNGGTRMPRLHAGLTTGFTIDVPAHSTWSMIFFGSLRVSNLPEGCYGNELLNHEGQIVICRNASGAPVNIYAYTNISLSSTSLNQEEIKIEAVSQKLNSDSCAASEPLSIYENVGKDNFSSWMCSLFKGFKEAPLAIRESSFLKALVFLKMSRESGQLIPSLKALDLIDDGEVLQINTVKGALRQRVANKFLRRLFTGLEN